MLQLKYFFLFCLLLLSQPGLSHETSLRLVTEHWPPMSFEKSGTAQGMAVDLARMIQKHLSMHNQVEVQPWTRAYKTALTQPNVLLFTLVRTPEREKIFTLLGPIADGDISLYMSAHAKNRKTITLDEIKRGLTVGTHRGTAFHNLLKQQGFEHIVPVNSSESAVRMLMSGRVEVLCDDDLAVAELFRRTGYKEKDYVKVASLKSSSLYFAFSQGTDPHLIRNWHTALTEIKRSGEFEDLYRKWFSHLKAPKEVLLLTPPVQAGFTLPETPVKTPQVAELLRFRPPYSK